MPPYIGKAERYRRVAFFRLEELSRKSKEEYLVESYQRILVLSTPWIVVHVRFLLILKTYDLFFFYYLYHN